MRILGIDPGLKGAFALWDGTKLSVIDPPTKSVSSKKTARTMDWDTLFVRLHHADFLSNIDVCFLEMAGARPGQGVSSMFKFGQVYGGVQGILAANQIRTTIVSPIKWKNKYGLGATKRLSCERATEIFPQYRDDFYGKRGGLLDGRAEAALIAHYGYQISRETI